MNINDVPRCLEVCTMYNDDKMFFSNWRSYRLRSHLSITLRVSVMTCVTLPLSLLYCYVLIFINFQKKHKHHISFKCCKKKIIGPNQHTDTRDKVRLGQWGSFISWLLPSFVSQYLNIHRTWEKFITGKTGWEKVWVSISFSLPQ